MKDLCITSSLSLRGGLRPTKQSHKALIIEEIATAHMRLAMTGSELCKGLKTVIDLADSKYDIIDIYDNIRKPHRSA